MSQDANTPLHDVDADLCACLDDECGPDQRDRAASALKRDPALARRLAMWRRNDSTLRAAFDQTRPQIRPPDGALPPIGPLENKAPGIALRAAAIYLAGVLSAGAALVVLRLSGAL